MNLKPFISNSNVINYFSINYLHFAIFSIVIVISNNSVNPFRTLLVRVILVLNIRVGFPKTISLVLIAGVGL